MTTAQAAEQQPFDLGAHGGQHSFQTGVGQKVIAMGMPLLEQPLRLLQQVFPVYPTIVFFEVKNSPLAKIY